MRNQKDLILVLKIGENKKPSHFDSNPNQARYIQHFPGGYKIESKVPAEVPVPYQALPYVGYGSLFGTPYSPYHASPYPGFGIYAHTPSNPYFNNRFCNLN